MLARWSGLVVDRAGWLLVVRWCDGRPACLPDCVLTWLTGDGRRQMVSTFGYLLGVAVEVQLKVCKSEEFARELCKKAVDESSDLVLVPCRKQVRQRPLLTTARSRGVISGTRSPMYLAPPPLWSLPACPHCLRSVPVWYRHGWCCCCRGQVKYVGDYHQRFVSDLIEGCRKTLLLFWDHHLGPQLLHRRAVGAAKRVVVLFQGGPHDREVGRQPQAVLPQPQAGREGGAGCGEGARQAVDDE